MRLLRNAFNFMLENGISFFVNKYVSDIIYRFQLLNICKFWRCFKNAKYFNIERYELKETNVSDGQLLMIFCYLIKKALCKCYYHHIWCCSGRKISSRSFSPAFTSHLTPYIKLPAYVRTSCWRATSILMAVRNGFMNFIQFGRYKLNVDARSQFCHFIVNTSK